MRLTLNWLKDYVDVDGMTPEALAHLLTMAGLEVEALEPLGRGLEDVVTGRVISVEKHPNADRLTVCKVDGGRGEVEVVCGAPNVRGGMMTAYAPPGTRLPNGPAVKAAKIRGRASQGILLAEDEMGLTDDHSGIMELPGTLNPGVPLNRVMPLEDWALEIGLTPNRPDCTSVMGVAREVAALTGQSLHRPAIPVPEERPTIAEHTDVVVEDPAGCPRYSAGIVWKVTLGPSPFWMRHRLHASGVRSINNVVDVTNYVLLECGQPLHAFDYQRLGEHRIVVRRAGEGEIFTTLDGQERRLTAGDLMICDGRGSVALAGVMGGLNSEIQEDTRDVLVESACFDPLTIRRTSKRLGLLTEASYRFERGIDIEGTVWALGRAMHLLAELAGGTIEPGVIDVYPKPWEPREIVLRVDKANSFLGTDLDIGTMAGYLSRLEMDVHQEDGHRLRVMPPPCRVDLEREVDLMEEVARMEGYDRIPVTQPAVRPEEEPAPAEVALGERIREIMAGAGFSEAINFSFVSEEAPDMLGAPSHSRLRNAVRLLKPLTQEQSVMRTTLLPGLLQAAQSNKAHGEADLKLFEWGKVFLPDEEGELPHERLTLAAVLTGVWVHRTIHQESRAADFYDAKGVLEVLLEALGLTEPCFERSDVPPPGYHPERTARVLPAGTPGGWVGEAAPEAVERFELGPERVFLMELDIPVLQDAMPATKTFEPYARFPAVLRDLSVVVKAGVESERVRSIIAEEKLVESAELFDLYRGDQIAPSEKALTFRICFRSPKRTLKGREVNALHEKIVRKIREQVGGRLRDR